MITISKCPPKLKGDLTKWLLEISTGVFCGNINARVRDELWERITANIDTGRAAMIFSAQNEQRLDFRVHNSKWVPVDYEGIRLILKPAVDNAEEEEPETVQDKPEKQKKPSKSPGAVRHQKERTLPVNYTVIDIETTGLDAEQDRIIELGAVRMRNDQQEDVFQCLVDYQGKLPEVIIELTGITTDHLQREGLPPQTALEKFNAFTEGEFLICHNAKFDLAFLKKEYARAGLTFPDHEIVDTLKLARKKVHSIMNYRLVTLIDYFKLPMKQSHRAVEDCLITAALYRELKKL